MNGIDLIAIVETFSMCLDMPVVLDDGRPIQSAILTPGSNAIVLSTEPDPRWRAKLGKSEWEINREVTE